MAKHNSKAGKSKCKFAEAKESAMLRMLRIDGSQNGATLRTRVVRDKTKYCRNVKHKESLADARDFAFLASVCCARTCNARTVRLYLNLPTSSEY